MLAEKCDVLFDSELGRETYEKINLKIQEHNMLPMIMRGVIVGLSGGADSVLLLIFLRKLKIKLNFPLFAVHINHNIRGDDAKRDERFSRELCSALDINFESFSVDIPSIAKELKAGIEVTARNERYRLFNLFSNACGAKTIAVAHNATDNSETFILNLLRGAGTHGLSSIPPVRDNIIRPLLTVSKSDITALLVNGNIPFVTDETNFSSDYSRNYVRNEILPRLERLTPDVDRAFTRAISNIRADDEYLSMVAESFINDFYFDEKLPVLDLTSLSPAIFSRVLISVASKSGISLEKYHVDKIYSMLLNGDNFSLDLPGAVSFFRSFDKCYFFKKEDIASENLSVPLKMGFTEISELGIAVEIADDVPLNSPNVYKYSIQALISSDIIVNELFVRTKKDGDSYRFGGITRKLKKLFLEKKIPQSQRSRIPVICDSNGIVWVPGFRVRDGLLPQKGKKSLYITVYYN